MSLNEMEEGKKIGVLLDHWIKHNHDHAAEYEKWAEKMEKGELEKVSPYLKKASELIIRCNQEFIQAKEVLEDMKKKE